LGVTVAGYAGIVARKHILLIDHRPEHMRQPVLRLQLEGYEVDEATDGETGLEQLAKRQYDLLLLDAELPGADDGWETLRRIRSQDELKDLKVIVFMAGKGETGKLALLPVDAELRRPFPIGELLDKVRKVLGQK
jgi:DNA-binding response OmpR family regulator